MKKNLKKAIILSLLLTCSYHQQSWADELGTIKYSGGGIENIGDGHTITNMDTSSTTHGRGIDISYISQQHAGGGTVTGSNLTINTAGAALSAQSYYNAAAPGIVFSADSIIILEGTNHITNVGSGSYGQAIRAMSHSTAFEQKAEIYLLGEGNTITAGGIAIGADGNKSLVAIGDRATITGHSYGGSVAVISNADGGRIEIGDYATIIHRNDDKSSSNINGMAVMSRTTDGYIKIGNNSTIATSAAGALGSSNHNGNHAVSAGFTSNGNTYAGKIIIGDSANISTQMAGSHAVRSVHADSSIEIGDYAIISTAGNNSSAVRVGEIDAARNLLISGGVINIGTGALITTEGDAAYGLEARYANSVLNISDVTLVTEGTESHGVIAHLGGSINLDGATITVDTDKNAYAVLASGIDANTNEASNVTGNGEYHITGDIKAENGGIINLDFAAGSTFVGATAVDVNNSSANNLTLGTDSLWLVTGDSLLNSLTNNGGTVDLSYKNNVFNTLTVENLNGNNGTIILGIDGTQPHQSDQLIVTDTFTGTQQIALREINGLHNDPALGKDAEGTVLVSVKINEGTFTAVDGEGTLYYKRYELDKKDSLSKSTTTEWYLKGVENVDPGEKPTTSVNTIAAAGALSYYTWRDNDQLVKRMGDLRKNGGEEQGAWVRLSGSNIKRSGNFSFENKFNRYEFGYDQKLRATDKITVYGGLALSYSDGNSSYDRGSGDNKDKALSLYLTQIGAKGHYLDIVAKVNRMDTDFKVYDNDLNRISGDFDNTGISLSAEYGRKNSLQNNWYIEPQVQLTVGRFGSASYTTSNGIAANQSSINSAVSRFGFNIGKDITEKTNVYLKADWLHEFGGSYAMTMTNIGRERVRVDRSYGDTWFEYGIGASVQTSRNNYFYLDLERSSGSDFKKDWYWNIGSRWTF